MLRAMALGAGGLWLVVTTSCGDEKAPESKVGQAVGGGGAGGAAGSLTLGQDGGSGGAASGAGGASGGGGSNAAGAATSGASHGGASGRGGTGGATAGSSGAGGGQTSEPCQRAPSFDPDCIDLFPELPQAYTCSSVTAASMLNQMHDGTCASISLIGGGRYNECCPP
jgi:hypothetical protein